MAVTFSLTLNGGGSSYSALYADLAWAAADWASYLNSNADIRVQVDVGGFPNNEGFVIQNDSTDFVTVGTTAQGKTLVEPWGEYALQTGSHVPGSAYDIHIYLNLDTNPGGADVYSNPNPGNGATVPYGEYDATTMFLKALGYGLGFAAMSTTNTPGIATDATTLDQYVQLSPNGPTGVSLGVDDIGLYELTGPVVEAVYGRPVPLVTPGGETEAFVHVGNTPTVAGASDIMAVTQDIAGQSLGISRLDLAIMQEAGVPIVPGVLPCFAQGTLIATPRGTVPIEALRKGAAVCTAAGTEARIKWLGWRHVDCRRQPRPEDLWPVRIAAGAFGEGQPARPLLLSPDHAVFAEGKEAAGAPGVLIPIRHLVNGATIARQPTDRITYWHLELDRHAIVLANGLPCESYLDTGNRAAFANGGTTVMMTPDFARHVWDAEACAKLVLRGPRLIVTKRRLLRRAVALGHVATNEPMLRVFAQRREVLAQTDGKRVRVALPDRAEEIRLVSRVWKPAEMQAGTDDPRRLGVAIGRLWLDRREVSLESPGLSGGWHPPEPKWRWTDGDARLATDGVRELAFELAMTGLYWRDDAFTAAWPAVNADEPKRHATRA